jgi:hypothetical protein
MQIENINSDLYEIEDMVERSKKIMARMLRSTLTNKCVARSSRRHRCRRCSCSLPHHERLH